MGDKSISHRENDKCKVPGPNAHFVEIGVTADQVKQSLPIPVWMKWKGIGGGGLNRVMN